MNHEKWDWNFFVTQKIFQVCDVCWAPAVGRGYNLIASCGKDGHLQVHKLFQTPSGSLEPERPAAGLSSPFVVWRVEWYAMPDYYFYLSFISMHGQQL